MPTASSPSDDRPPLLRRGDRLVFPRSLGELIARMADPLVVMELLAVHEHSAGKVMEMRPVSLPADALTKLIP